MRIRWRLALYAATVTLIGVVEFVVLMLILGNTASSSDQEKSLATAVDKAVTDFAAVDLEQLLDSIEPFPVDSPESLDVFVAAVDVEGTVRYTTGFVIGNEPDVPAAVILEALDRGSSAAVATNQGVELRMAARPWPNEWSGEGVLVAMQPTAFSEQQLRGLSAVLWIAGIITLIATTIVGWLVSGRAVRPLEKLAETTDAIGATGDLSQRLPPVHAKDEVGRLTLSFNAMLHRLQESQRRLADSLDAQRQFVADASHELRSPLTTIRSNAGFLIDRPNADTVDRDEAIADVAAEADRMTLLVDDLLMLARGDEGFDLVRRPVDLVLVAADVGRRAERRGLDISVHAAGTAMVIGDEATLDRLMWILVDNAAKHGGQPVRLEVLTSDRRAAIRVVDSGPGFPEGAIDKVFDRFFRADPARSPAGAGLGLSIARWIADAHEGTITAANRDAGGAVVTVDIPKA